MNRKACYGAGVLAMGCLLVLAIMGERGTAADPYAARGALVAVFVAVHVRRYQCRAIRRGTVVGSALSGALLLIAAHRITALDMAAISVGDAVSALVACTVSTALMALSFHYLTLRRGFMV